MLVEWCRRVLAQLVGEGEHVQAIDDAPPWRSNESHQPEREELAAFPGMTGVLPERRGLTPSTLDAEQSNCNLNRPVVFDPALRQYSRAHRAGEPRFDYPEDALRWYELRTKVLHRVLRRIADSEQGKHLVLRGSALLNTWLGVRARRPGDLDWVVTPRDWKLSQRESRELMRGITSELRGTTICPGVEIPDQSFAETEIWTYEKAPGRRVIVPWNHSQQHFGGTLQMDFVFGEPMPSAPVWTDVRVGDLPPVSMQTASRAQSLAWKLQWLATDQYALGKDLYDAVMLAESTALPVDLVRLTFDLSATEWFHPLTGFNRHTLSTWYVEWDEFVKEYPRISGTANEWLNRLADALGPLFEELKKPKTEDD